MVEILDIEGYTFDKEVLRLALEEYEKFKETEEYTEAYKWEIFEEMNNWFKENKITKQNVVEYVEFLDDKNPQSGTFVDWREINDLYEFAKENPDELAELFDNLYHSQENLQDRLENFREKTGIGTPGLGYVLAAYDYEEYAPIKVDQFRDFIYHFADEVPTKIGSFSVPEKYAFYHDYCHKMLEFLEEEEIVEDGTPLDVQDFYYTTESYDEINKEKIFLKYIWQFCQRFDEFKKNSELLIEEINSLPIDFLKSERESYEDSEKVNKIRYLTLDNLIEDGDVDIEKIETEVNSEYEKNILQAWTSFTIHSQIYWDYFSDRLNNYFESICEFLINNIEVEGLEYNLVTFQGSRGRPTVKPYVLIYPEGKGDHRDSYQFFFRILPEKIQYGLSHGENIEDSDFEEKYVGEITDIDENSLEQIVKRYNQFSDEFRELNNLSMDTDEDIKWYIDKYKELHDYQSELDKRKEFERKYRKIFDPDNLDELDKEDVFSFLRDSFWPGLHRSKKKLTEDMDKLRKSIEYLLDEDEDIKERLNNVVDNSDSEYWIRGMGKNLASAIISIMDDTDEYGILNERAVGAMKKLGIYPEEIKTTMSTGEKYVKINEVLKQLNDMGLENMWDVDYFVYWLDENYEKLNRVTTEKSKEFKDVFLNKKDEKNARKHFQKVLEYIEDTEKHTHLICTTFKNNKNKLAIDYGRWWIFSISRKKNEYIAHMAVDKTIIPDDFEEWPELKRKPKKPFHADENVVFLGVEWDKDLFKKRPVLQKALFSAIDNAKEAFQDLKRSPYKIHHRDEIYNWMMEGVKTLDEEETNYFWVTASPDRWEVSEIEDGGDVFYTAFNKRGNKRRIFDAFKKAKPGDRVIFYESSPVNKVVAEGEIIQGMHFEEHEEYGGAVKGIRIKYTQPINKITWGNLTEVDDLKNSSPIKSGAHGSLFELTKKEYDTILALDLDPEVKEIKKKDKLSGIHESDLDIGELELTNDLYFPDDIRDQIRISIESAIKSGKNIIFTGPPGTGKTKIAKNVAEYIKNENECVNDFTFATATADWTTFDTIGGYHPQKEGDGLEFKPGQFLKCFKNKSGMPVNKWLIIDEINRADIDKAFGQLFSVLSKDRVELPFNDDEENQISIVPLGEDDIEYKDSSYYVTKNWRLLATMNTYDKASLYEMSYAFMRRFAFIDVSVPASEALDMNELDKYIECWDLEDIDEDILEKVLNIWKTLIDNNRAIGPAIIKDILGFVSANEGDGVLTALKLFVLPQFEGMVKTNQKKIIKALGKCGIDKDGLYKVAEERFDIEIDEDE